MSLRVFAALPVPEEIAEQVTPLLKGVPGAKWRPQENFHITLAYYGEWPEDTIAELDHELSLIRVAPFDLRLTGTGHFGKASPTQLWLGVEGGEALERLARQCYRAGTRAGMEMEKRNYTPHLTVAYLNMAEIVRVQKFHERLNLWQSQPFLADRFHLYSSHARGRGPNAYEIEAEYPLMG
jgi:2'-5' RNA ligase